MTQRSFFNITNTDLTLEEVVTWLNRSLSLNVIFFAIHFGGKVIGRNFCEMALVIIVLPERHNWAVP